MSDQPTTADNAQPHRGATKRPLRVLCPVSYFNPFTIELGQRNATHTRRPLNRHTSWRWYRGFRGYMQDAFTLATGFGFDLVHTINAVPAISRKPFVITFEGALPRIWNDPTQARMRQRLWRRLFSPRCLALIAMSHWGLREWRRLYQSFEGFDELAQRVQVMHPVMRVRRDKPKPHSSRLAVSFIGKEFMRKGMPIVLRAHRLLRQRGVPVDTTVVSSLLWSPNDYIGPGEGYDIDAEKKLLEQDGVTHHARLDNARVLELLESSDYSLCPTFHDTFGFAVLESMSVGTPVIATGTCALPEIIEHGRSGYLLPMENDATGQWVGGRHRGRSDSNDQYRAAVDQLAAALADTLEQCWSRRAEYEAVSAAALDRMKQAFAVEPARDRLETIYERAR